MDNPSAPTEGGLVTAQPAAVPTVAFKTGNDTVDAMPLATQVWFNEQLYECVARAAKMMANAEGFVATDLIGKTETCFAVALDALDAGLSPFFLAQGSFQTPEGKVGYDTKRIQAIVEAKGFFKKPPTLDYSGPWENLIGKFKKEKSERKGPGGRDKYYTVKTWTANDAKGCKLRVTFHFADMDEPVVCEEMDLAEVGTHFSTQWATEPKPQFARFCVRRQLDLKRPSLRGGLPPCIDDIIEHEQPMKEVNERPQKTGDAGLDGFAAEGGAGETVIEPDGTPSSDAEPAAKAEPQKTAAAERTPSKDASPDAVVIWASEEEPERELASISNAVFVLRNLIREAKTTELAQAIFDRNLGLIAQAGSDAGNNLEAELQRRMQRAQDEQKGTEGGEANPEASNGQTVWLGPDDPAHPYTGQGNAIHLIRTGIREAKTAAVAKTIRDQNAELIDGMPDRIGADLEFEVSKRFEGGNQSSKTLL